MLGARPTLPLPLSFCGLIPPLKSLSDIFMVSVRELKYLLRLNAGAHTLKHTHMQILLVCVCVCLCVLCVCLLC